MPTIFVVGGTGQQGGGVLNALLSHGHSDLVIRALTRNPSSSAARTLETRGVQPVKGDLLDRSSLLAALAGVDRAYLVTDFRGPEDVEGELKQGRLFIDTAKEAGVSHIVFSSVAGADIAQAVDHFYTKFKLEEDLRASGLGWTIVRPVGFMEVIPPTLTSSSKPSRKEKVSKARDVSMFDWLYYENCQPGSVDETKILVPDVMDIETWARMQKALRAAN